MIAYMRRFGRNRNAVGVPGGNAVVVRTMDDVTGGARGVTGLVEKSQVVAVGSPALHFKETPLGNTAPWGRGLTVAV